MIQNHVSLRRLQRCELVLSANIFTLPAGAPFLATLSRALLSGELIAGFPSGGPLDLARATIYVPTQRAAAALARELVAASGKPSLILPRIAPLGAFEPTVDMVDLSAPGDSAFGERPAVGELARRMILARMIRAWGEALRGAIRRCGPDGSLAVDESERPLVASSPAQAFALAGDLAALIDDMIIEGVPWERLDKLAGDAFDPYWRITLDFLKIAIQAWPKWLDEQGLVDGATRAAEAVEREIAAMSQGLSRGPTLIAGSTGTNRATARLIGAIARASDGAVVLPDLDLDLDEASFASIGAGDDDGAGAAAGHPQAALRRLLDAIGVKREEVKTLAVPSPALRSRARFLSQALRPADSTHFWSDPERRLRAEDMREGLAGVALIVADNETEEALALAAAMREALETPERTAALITPDAALARRVAAELERWGVEVENSAGRSLGDARSGLFARLALAAGLDFKPRPVASLIEHPLVGLGRSKADFAKAARALELAVLRALLPAAGLDDIEAAFEVARAAAAERHAHRALKTLTPADFDAAQSLLGELKSAVAPLRGLGRAPLADYIAAHRAALVALAAPDDLAAAPGGEAVEALFEEWSLASQGAFDVTLGDYAALFEPLIAATRAPPERAGHPRLAILGLLEARLLSFDLTLLGGLDETTWPPAAQTDAFLNRPMRASLGLSSPERRIGQTAHDFTAALGARETILSRAAKRGGSPTVASRFLQRMGAVAGEAAMGEIEARGSRYLALARLLDKPDAQAPIKRPAPRPKRDLRPRGLSVTQVETLRRDPYAIFAEKILGLAPLAPIGREAGPREIGDVWHATLQAFSEGTPGGEGAQEASERIMSIAAREFAALNAEAAFRALRWPRVLRGLEEFLAFDAERRALARALWFERFGALEIEYEKGAVFTLNARADRIELLHDGRAVIIDYKTGAPPGANEVKVGFAPQLTLEAAMIARGAFKEIGAVETATAYYFKLGGADGGFKREVKFKDATFGDVVAEHFAGLKALIAQFAREDTPYLSRPFPKFLGRGSDYDHLARVKEWSATGDAADDNGGEA